MLKNCLMCGIEFDAAKPHLNHSKFCDKRCAERRKFCSPACRHNYYEKLNPIKVKLGKRKWKAENRIEVNAYLRRYFKFKRTRVIDVLKQRDGDLCRICGEKEPIVKHTIDHIYPRAKGGGDEIENLQILCFMCNSRKRDLLMDSIPYIRQKSIN